MPTKSVAPALVAVMILASSAAIGSAQEEEEEGHWDLLGEDGAVFVPRHPPATPAYLPGPDLGAYHNATEAKALLESLVAARPDLLSLRVAGSSVQGRPILVATLTAPGDPSGRSRALFDGAHHGDEVIASEILLRFVTRALAEYDTNATMRAILANTVVEIVPMVNPDGIDFVPQCSHYAQCRKNANGVDLNRNYPDHWGGTGSSGNPSDATYRGPSPASEPETRVIRDLLDASAYSVYASLHSGAEMILWPWGWTTTSPPELPVYNTLGAELSALTGAPHGQVSKILYGVSGDSMDQAYGGSAGWRALAVSPETYEGSGTAFDWWFLFNPPETESAISPVVARWERFLWHLAAEAPQYAPAKIAAPASATLGPDAEELNVVVTGAPKRPFLGASLRLAANAEAIEVLSPNPLALANASGPQARDFTLLPLQGGSTAASLELNAGPAGRLTRAIQLDLVQVGLALALERASMGSPETNNATIVVDAGPFQSVSGDVSLVAYPEGVALGSASFSATPGAPATIELGFDGLALRGGAHNITALATFTAVDAEGVASAGQLRAHAPLLVLRPQVDLDKRFLATTSAGQGVLVTSIYRNTGSSTAEGVVVRETIPLGYSYYFRDGPVPVPTDPLGRPVPSALEVQEDGSVVATWTFGNVAPGQTRFAQYRLLALVPGEHALASEWSYQGSFPSGPVLYEEAAAPMHRVVPP